MRTILTETGDYTVAVFPENSEVGQRGCTSILEEAHVLKNYIGIYVKYKCFS